MRLRTILHDCPKAVLDALENCGIKTDDDMAFSVSTTTLFRKLPPDTLTLAELESLRRRVIDSLAAKGQSGEELLHGSGTSSDSSAQTHWRTGVPDFDSLLQALNHGIIEVAGARSSGKTALALSLSMFCLMEHEYNSVHWIDTTGEFSPERASAVLKKHLANNKDLSVATSSRDSALQRLHVSTAFTIEAAHNVLQFIRSDVQTHRRVRLLVIDPITPLFGPRLSTVSSEGHAMMTAFMQELRSLSIEKSLLVLITNTATDAQPSNPGSAFASTKLKPALGPTFSFLTDVTLWISKAQVALNSRDAELANTFIAEVTRSRITMDRHWWPFDMDGIIREASLTKSKEDIGFSN